MDSAPPLNEPWPPDLDIDDVPFRKRSVPFLHRLGYSDDPSLSNDLT